jgi:hypothetical protein
VSKNIDVARSTCYLILEKLKALGLIIETPFGKKRSLLAQDPNNLINLLKEKKENSEKAYDLVQQILPELSPYSKVSVGTKVRFYEGFESIKQIYNESLEAEFISVFCLTQNSNVEFKKFIENYMNRLIKKGIKTCEVVTDYESDIEYKNKFTTDLNKIICVPKDFCADTDYMLWDNKVAFISFKNQIYTGIIIEDQEIANFEKKRFDLLWKLFTR